VIVNPEAGSHETKESTETIMAGLEDAGIEGTLRVTERAEDTKRFATEAAAEGTDLLVVAGGDGTVMGAVGALANSGIPLLPLPLGTWNGLVRMLGAPMSIAKTLEMCLAGRPVKIDVGYIPDLDRHFLLWAGAGIDAEVMGHVERDGSKKRWGYWAYLGALTERLGGSRNHRLELTVDERTRVYEGHTVMAFNVNDLRFAGLQIGPLVDPHDGKMDLTVLTRSGLLGTTLEMARVLTSGDRTKEVEPDDMWVAASRVRIDAEPALDVQADGEVVGRTPLTLEVLPRALTVQAPMGYRGELDPDATEEPGDGGTSR
jgi:YegS/Rv2252/BmrU family lipid kinase